jgi:hypothetical protein
MKITPSLAKIGKQFGVLLAFMLGLILIVYFASQMLLRSARDSLISHATPTANYEEAVARFEKLQSSDGSTINPVARSILLTHAHRTNKVVVFFHGYSTSPQQFRQLGERFFQLGYNVLIPRLPEHGIATASSRTCRGCAPSNCATALTQVWTSPPALAIRSTSAGYQRAGLWRHG